MQARKMWRHFVSGRGPGWPSNMPRLQEGQNNSQLMAIDEMGTRARELQRTLFDGGFAGLCFPKEYGGQGLTRAHQIAFTQETAPYEMPVTLNIPTFSILAPTLLDFGTEEQKRAHLPKMISGEEIWVQFLSEPSGGSDLASLVTRATRDGDVFILNGSKIWSSGAFRCDYAMCLARTDWHAPKHRGLTMFIIKIHQPGIDVQQIKMSNGSNEFCQEFFDDVAIPVEDVLGEVNDGWTVASRLLFHERDAVGGGSPYLSGTSGGRGDHGARPERPDRAGAGGRACVRSAGGPAGGRSACQRCGRSPTHRAHHQGHQRRAPCLVRAGSLFRLYAATNAERHADIALEIAGRQRRRLGGRGSARAQGYRVPPTPGRQPGWRQQRDAAQHHQ